MSTACFQGSLLTNCERQNFVSRDDKMIIKNNRASIEGSGYFHFDNDFRSVLFDAERIEMEFIFRNCLRNPVPIVFFPCSVSASSCTTASSEKQERIDCTSCRLLESPYF